MPLVVRPRPRLAVIAAKSASLSRRGRGLHCTMVFLLFDQMHGEIVGFVQRKVGLSAGGATFEFGRRPATDLPFAGESYTIRWLFLGVGALAGSAIWIRSNRTQAFGLSML